jgi:hypothetical protein
MPPTPTYEQPNVPTGWGLGGFPPNITLANRFNVSIKTLDDVRKRTRKQQSKGTTEQVLIHCSHVPLFIRSNTMNTNEKNTNTQNKQDDQNRRDEDQFWTNWWREYAQTWK